MSIHSEAELHRKYVAFAKLLNIYLNHFPKHEKYALSQRIRDTAYEVYDLITEAQKRYHKKTTLTNLDIRHQQLRMQLNLANELEYYQFKDGRRYPDNPAEVAAKRYLAISRHVDELGRMIGGWLHAEKAKQATTS